ncbi:MAG: protoporphyrinogen oxidase [Mariniblastus sp.]
MPIAHTTNIAVNEIFSQHTFNFVFNPMNATPKSHRPDAPTRWGIVGGGALGMTLAYRMAQAGKQVTLIEAAPKLGGLASTWKLNEVEWERYYHVILLSDSRLRNLLKEIGLSDELRWVETKTGFFTDGKLYSMSNTAEFLGFPPLTLIEKLRLGGTIFYASKIRNWKRLEKISVATWLKRWSGKGTFKKIWEPLLKAKLGESYERTAASFIWAHISRMYKARRTGLKKEMFGYVRGGYQTVIQRLTERLEELGVEIKTACPTQSIVRGDDGIITVSSDAGDQQFDRVVMTTPNSVVHRICPQLSTDETQRLQNTEYLGICCASMLLKNPISPYYVTNITDTWVPMTAVIELTNIVETSETGGKSLVYLPKYVPADHELFNRSDESIQEDFVSALEKMYPEFSRDDIEAFRISRTRSVMAIPTLEYSKSLPPMKTSVPGLFLVNSAFIVKGNLNVNETITIAEDALAGVLKPELEESPVSS